MIHGEEDYLRGPEQSDLLIDTIYLEPAIGFYYTNNGHVWKTNPFYVPKIFVFWQCTFCISLHVNEFGFVSMVYLSKLWNKSGCIL